jgi:Protein of unknown function (DUF2735)
MTTSSSPESAKIYQFPARGRFASAGREDSKSAVAMMSPRVAPATFGGAWYHEEAIRDAEGARKN